MLITKEQNVHVYMKVSKAGGNTLLGCLTDLWQYIYIGTIFVALSIWVCQVSLVLFMLRVVQRPLHRRILRWIVIITGLYGIGASVAIAIQCHPVSKYWDQAEHGWCLDKNLEGWLIYSKQPSRRLIRANLT